MQIYAGRNTSLAISKEGEVYAWGDTRNLFPINDIVDLPIPVDLPEVFKGRGEHVK